MFLGIAGPSAANQQQNVSEKYHQDLTKLTLGNLLAGPSAAHQQQNVSAQYHQELTKLELGNRLLKAQLMQKEMMDEINGLKKKVAKMEQQQQKEDAFIGQIKKLEDKQKECLDKYEELEKELARKYICIGQFAKLLSRIDKMEAQINGMKEMGQGTNSSLPNRSGMEIDLETMDGKIITLSNVHPSTTIKEIMAKIEDIKHIPIKQQRLLFDGYVLSEDCTLADYNIGNGNKIYLILRLCGC
ncbi:hypothetical protein niasHT_012277 [Heterodera trifolii]|uniref:Ubiquitin-like domain-containing protein n=1 Tax=Heterodera trifolii TaxID=157864 RepID=A0ABD2LDX3_9BILA